MKHSSLVPSFDSTQTKFWRERIIKWKKRYPLIIPKTNIELSPQYIVNRVSELFPNAYFTTDVGQHQMWAAQFLKCNIRKWLSSAGLGTMGYGLPAAVGTQLAFPNSTVICISGDASFQMNLQELGTISQYKLPIKIFILNNRWQGMVRQWQQSFYDERYSHSSMKDGMPDFVMLAESYGIKSKRIQSLEDFLSIENELVTSNQPFLVDFQVHETENCYPMVAPGKSNSQMIGLTAELSSNLVKKVIS